MTTMSPPEGDHESGEVPAYRSDAIPVLPPGARRTTQDGQILALSPAPVATGERAVDANSWIRRKTEGWLDLQGGNLLFSAEFALMFLSLSILSTGFLGFGLMLALGPDSNGNWDWGSPLYIFVGNLMVSLPWGLYLYFVSNNALKESPPIRLNRQRREVAVPRWTDGEKLKLPFWNTNAGLIAYILLILTIVYLSSAVTQGNSSDQYRDMLVFWGLVVLGVEITVIALYLFIALRLKKKHAPRLIYEIHPWEKLVAYIETQQNIGPSLMTTNTFLTLAIPKPDDPESALAAAKINVGHETAGLAQWECIRRFMEDGPEACPDPRNDDTLAHIITERRIKTLALRGLPEELKASSEPLPEAQWAKPSEELRAINEQLIRAYEGGLRFTRVGPLSKWQEAPKEKRQKKQAKGRFRA
ncbi:hypothetical protein [Marinobacter confluentis]|uniref:Uncharacterized protein n=1 Tax=Marinobacter confluentis TaxID=1697557 RepID=A0A4Z1C9C4_9GAMM|nr:hypothetical protein [Marinobacter confluentis]TGN39956.1 hypothetical protein E5Q11_06575 [Marinobacter confluentis]